MPKVLHVINSLGRGGIERWLISMLEHIDRANCPMDMCCKGDSVGALAPLARERGAKVYLRTLKMTQLGFVDSLRRLVATEGYDIIHNHLQAYSGLPAYVGHKLGVPVITSFHCTEFPAQTWLRRPVLRYLRETYSYVSVKYALRHSLMITGCSHDVVQSIRRIYGESKNAWRVLQYGVDLPALPTIDEKQCLRKSFGWSEDTPLVVHVGRFTEQKNHFGLLRIFELVLRRCSTAKLLLIGDGPLRATIENEVEKNQLSHAVKFLGSRDDVADIVSRCSLFLFPSWYEGLPVAALEASAAAIPVVASKVPGISEAIEDGVTGWLREPIDVQGMAEAAICLLNNAGLANGLGIAGRNRIANRFSKHISANVLMSVYNECFSQH